MVKMSDVNESNRLEQSMGEDLDPKWNEPSTRGDIRLLAIRIDSKFDQFDSKFDQFDSKFTQIDSRFDQLRADFRNLATEIDTKFDRFHGGIVLFGSIITANLAMFGIFATLLN